MFIDVDWDLNLFEQCVHAFDGVSHHVSSDMVWVVVASHYACNAHSVCFGDVDEVSNGVGRIDDHTFACGSISNEISEIDHLLCNGVIDTKVSAAE